MENKESNQTTEKSKAEQMPVQKPAEQKAAAKKEAKATRTVVVVRGNDVSISTKHSMAICNFIKGKKIDYSIKFLEEVIKFKKAVPMKGELPHRKGIGEGRYPIKASKAFILLLKSLKANANSFNMDASKLVLHAKANRASRPRKPGKYHRRFKRTHIEIVGTMEK